jgi:hypothetical protein
VETLVSGNRQAGDVYERARRTDARREQADTLSAMLPPLPALPRYVTMTVLTIAF